MGESVKKEFWYIMVEGVIDDDHAAIGNFYGYGEHLGEAVSHVLAAAAGEGFVNPEIGEVYLVEPDYRMPDDVVTLNDHVQHSPGKYLFPLADLGSALVFPTGIAMAGYESENNPDFIREAFCIHEKHKNDQGEYCMEVVAGKTRINELFFAFVRLCDNINGLFFRLPDDWEGEPQEVWAFYESDAEKLVDILKGNPKDSLENGYLEIALTAAEGDRKSTLILTPHKTIRFFSQDAAIFDAAIRLANSLGLDETDDLYSIEHGYYHWHYRPFGSRSRAALRQWLVGSGFERTA